MEIEEDITVSEYFEKCVPQLFEEQIAKASVLGMEGTVAKLTFVIKGEETNTYSLVVKDAKELEVIKGTVDNPLLTLELDEDVWREAVTGKLGQAVDMFMDLGQMANRSRFDKVSSLAGSMVLELTRESCPNVKMKAIFNEKETPSVTFRCSIDDWIAISKGELPGVTAYMGGKLAIEGDMPFALELGNLVAS